MERRRVGNSDAVRILEAVDALEAARVERDAAMVAALKHGASVREVAACAGMSVTQTQKIGHEGGWPTAEQKKKWADEKARREEFNPYVDAYRRGELR